MTDELISKKSLLKNLDSVISEYKAQYSWKCDGVIVSILTSVRDLVSSKPTVYDIDKVIEQLEETFDRWGLDKGKKDIMLEIVKRGGVE